jgi:hypothetical protein
MPSFYVEFTIIILTIYCAQSNYFEDVDFLYGPYNVSEYAVPLNATFKYNIILDGHSHARHRKQLFSQLIYFKLSEPNLTTTNIACLTNTCISYR